MRNPSIQTTSGNFRISIYRSKTTVIYSWKSQIPGITTTSGNIKSVSLTKIDSKTSPSMNKIMDYELKFTLTNTIDVLI